MTAITKMHTTVNFTNKKITPKFIVVHDTGVPGQTDEGNGKYFQYTYRGASAHKFVDENSITEVVPDGLVAWHVGDDKDDSDDGINNYNTLGIELTAEYDKTFKQETLDNAKQVIQTWMKKYNIPAHRVVRHFDASGKNCPQFLNRDGKWTLWKEFHKFATGKDVAMNNGHKVKHTHVVEPGDTLWGLSKQYNATVGQIKEWNKLKSNLIVIGDKLTVGKSGNKPTDNPVKEKETTRAKLKEDGLWGPNFTGALQITAGTPVDKVISGQPRNGNTRNIFSAQYGNGGSMLIGTMQRRLGTPIDKVISDPSTMIRAWQRVLGTPPDGKISKPSMMVREAQRRYNAGTLKF